MTTILMIVGVFAGISVSMATLYALAQVLTREGVRRRAHLASLLAVLAVMAALLWREVGLARLLAWPLLAAALWATVAERGWYRVFPVLLQLFAAVLIAGAVALSPLPG